MESGGARTVCILRRMKRKSIGHWAWNAYNPAKALPEELKFQLLDGQERSIGEFTFVKIGILKGVELLTPWGPAKIDWPKGGTRLILGERELVRLKSAFLKNDVEMVFADGTTMKFIPKKGHKNDIEFTDGRGSIGIFQEEGALPVEHIGLKVQMTKEEVKRLAKHDRPKSIESREYVQMRVMTWGTLPLSEEDVVRALTIFASFGIIVDEIPT